MIRPAICSAAKRLARMKPGAILINTARGEVTDEAALFDALAARRIAAAGIDCYVQETPAVDHPFWSLPNVVVTPHIGGCTHASFRRYGDLGRQKRHRHHREYGNRPDMPDQPVRRASLKRVRIDALAASILLDP